MIGRSLLALLLAVMAAAVALGPRPARAAPAAQAPAAAETQAARRVMMMLDLGPEHYRSGSDYGGDYGDAMGAKARLRFARKVAREHGLAVVDSWPMPLIGVDCIILEIRDGRTIDAVVRELSAVPGVSWSQPLNQFEMLEARPPSPARAPAVSYNDRLFSAQPAASLWHLARLHAVATGRRSYAGGTPARTASCRRMIPSISASGRGGQPGTWMSTGTILSTPWRIV